MDNILRFVSGWKILKGILIMFRSCRMQIIELRIAVLVIYLHLLL